MTQKTDQSGAVSGAGAFGPYLNKIPANPFAESAADSVDDGAIGTSAWYYDEMTGEFRAN
ncbi:MAG: hypothetical protein IPK83_00465 [Planctomycetes bacterium]|nr:hypothetical protein [Planctomycetota bacterium]